MARFSARRNPALYLTSSAWNDHVQTGLAAVCHIEDYERDIIKKHEKTRRDKEDDRHAADRHI
jgi:uncharacterized protein (DUF1015 family)